MAKNQFPLLVLVLAVFTNCCDGSRSPAKLFHPLGDEVVNFINNVIKPNWTAGRNFHPDVDLGTIKNLCGVLPDSEKFRLPERRHFLHEAPTPNMFDARVNWPECPSLREIRDQGSCGSCWAFSSSEAMTDRYCIYHQGWKHFRFSAENLVSCCSECGHGCHGGYPARAFQHWVDTGIVSGGPYGSYQGCQPYEIPPCEHQVSGHRPNCTGDDHKTPKCHSTCKSSYGITYESDLHFGRKSYSLSKKPIHVQFEIMKHGPVVAAFKVYADFPLYKSGVYHHVYGEKIGKHAVKIIGWGEDENSVPYWLVSNSWNTDWGDRGTFKIRRGVNECGIESEIVAGLPGI